MIGQQPLTDEQEVERAERATQILQNEIWLEACQQIEGALAAQRQRVPMRETDMHTRLILCEQLWTQLKDYIQQIADTGQFARFEIERKTKLRETMERMFSGSLRE